MPIHPGCATEHNVRVIPVGLIFFVTPISVLGNVKTFQVVFTPHIPSLIKPCPSSRRLLTVAVDEKCAFFVLAMIKSMFLVYGNS